MRNILSLLVFTMIYVSCASDKKLDEKTALKLIQEEKGYPKVVEYEIYTADPEEAKKLLDLGLEKQGLITVQKIQASADVGRPLIMFSKKADPYLLPQTIEDKQANIQRVKIAEEVIEGVKKITEQEGGKSTVVEYSTSYENVSQFSVLNGVKTAKIRILKANFVFDGNEWGLN
jgi:hypothetical protein